MTIKPKLDLITLGRCGVDLYAQQIGARLEDVSSFAKYLGGSSTNIAACAARQGLRTGLITRVGDEHGGRFLREQLQREGVDTRAVLTDPERPTAMVLLGIKDKDTFPLVFVRENCADMAISADDLDADYIGSSKCLLITGTHFSTPAVHASSTAALKMAREQGVKTAIDIDYRPVLWGLTSRGDGETRFVADESVSSHLQSILPLFDLVIGTEEELHIAGGSDNTLQALRTVREHTQAVIVLKRGPFGATVFEGDIPDSLDDGITVEGVTVDVMNVLGAGDAFAAGFLRGWLNDEGFEQALRYANACGALVVSRHGCTPAMPTVPELDYYLAHSGEIPRPDQHQWLNHLHRVTTRVRREPWGELLIHAFDHRSQLVDMARAVGAPLEKITPLKQQLLEATQAVIEEDGLQGQAGILCDDTFGQDTLNTATGSGLWIGRPVEVPGSRPLALERGDSIGSQLISWPAEHIVKCLVFYHPDDNDNLRHAQERQVMNLWRACQISGHELLLEIIPPKLDGERCADHDEAVVRAVKRFYNLNVLPDWWKLPSLSAAALDQIEALIEERDSHCQGIVILGLDAPIDELAAGFKCCAQASRVRGFAVGRSIFGAPAQAWLAGLIEDAELQHQIKTNYRQVIAAWRGRAG
ncbi:MAG: bifunctional 5-dehydro-2-deoxygluconokinase/5-dehydro-2-deoxyphosphogluconate aldolase [Granulosicoccaceae bacterium]